MKQRADQARLEGDEQRERGELVAGRLPATMRSVKINTLYFNPDMNAPSRREKKKRK
jgi:hypothetical protein